MSTKIGLQGELLASSVLQGYGIDNDLVGKDGYDLLNLITFFTSGPKESKSWSCQNGTFAPDAAAKIHTDFKKGFIKAEVISYSDFIEYKGEQNCKDIGKMRFEGKDYIVSDADIITFKFNV